VDAPIHPLVIGLTGGIGSGKSSVAEVFASRGAVVIDADAASHAVSQPGQAGALAVAEAFGASFLDTSGAINRTALRERVFGDPSARKQLEALLHPLIRDEMHAQLRAAPADRYVIWMVPLLIESGRAREVCHRVAVVDCPEDVQIKRVQARSQLSEEAVRAIMAAQVARADRLAAADDVIDNSGNPAQTAPQVLRLHGFYSHLLCARLAPDAHSA
jgi:dephospho-CoA kinase